MTMAGLSIASRFDRAPLARIADGLAAGIAVVLPWSTSLTAILVVLWLIALIPTLAWPDIRRELGTWAGGLPVLLVVLGVLGVTWADVGWAERWNGVESYFKLLTIPILFAQFRRSENGHWVLGGYLASCVVLLVASTLVPLVFPFGPIYRGDHVLVKNAATQSGEFATCISGILYLILMAVRHRRWLWLTVCVCVVLGMLADMFFVSTGRTALVVIPVLLVLFAVKYLDYRGILLLVASAAVVCAVGWFSSPYLRERTTQAWVDVRNYQTSDEQNSSGERIEFAKKSLRFVAQAPIIGHGTGSIHDLFIRSSLGKIGAEGSATANPHNQTFAVAIQLGIIGAAVLWAMWIAHVVLFRGSGLVEWVGLVVVVQNIVGSLLNSHLFDFTQGWVYVVGVGVAGGMVFKAATGPPGAAP
jgi:O-antigen ligase